jgi:hypothetical protein
MGQNSKLSTRGRCCCGTQAGTTDTKPLRSEQPAVARIAIRLAFVVHVAIARQRLVAPVTVFPSAREAAFVPQLANGEHLLHLIDGFCAYVAFVRLNVHGSGWRYCRWYVWCFDCRPLESSC